MLKLTKEDARGSAGSACALHVHCQNFDQHYIQVTRLLGIKNLNNIVHCHSQNPNVLPGINYVRNYRVSKMELPYSRQILWDLFSNELVVFLGAFNH